MRGCSVVPDAGGVASPTCDHTLRGVIRIGLRVLCPNCEADLEVTDTHPVELDWVNDDLVDQDARW
jgi:hypothetical protein